MPKASRLTLALACLAFVPLANAKLPPPSEEAQAKAAEAAEKSAWSGKVAAYQLCRAQDRVVSSYRAKRLIAAKDLPPALDTAACVDPGPFSAAPTMEKAGAHSAPGPLPAPAAASAPKT